MIIAILIFVRVAAVDYTELFGEPYRSDQDTTVPNPTFTSMTTISSIAITYQGFAQGPSSTPPSNHFLFSVRLASGDQYVLPELYIDRRNYLSANISMTEAYSGLPIPLDTWFAFGIVIANGSPSAATLRIWNISTDASVSQTYPLQGSMLPSSTAVAVAPSLSSSSDPVYVTSLRIFDRTLSIDLAEIDYYAWMYPPATHFWQVGTELGVFAFEESPNGNVSCADREWIRALNTTY